MFSEKFKEKFKIGYEAALKKGGGVRVKKSTQSIFNILKKEDKKLLKKELKLNNRGKWNLFNKD